ncbi:MAG: hypothetical protein ACR2JV_07050 [Gaiellales bacterium]
MRRFPIVAIATAVCALALSAGIAGAAPIVPPQATLTHGPELGVVASRNAKATVLTTSSNLVFHNGGSVMHGPSNGPTNIYAIYWQGGASPLAGYPVSSTYLSTIGRYLADITAAGTAGATNNTYASTTQYNDAGGYVSSTFVNGGVLTDTNSFPATDGCTDTVTQTTRCLSNAQLGTEVLNFVTAKGLPTGMGTLYLLLTPQNVGSCYSSSSCAFTQYCAYHTSITGTLPTGGSARVLWANQPYTLTTSSGCASGSYPNGDAAADSTINVISHEHQEALTDPLGNAWFDSKGYEDADKCAWNFGTKLGNAANGYAYNQLINGSRYYLQQDWSNKSAKCVLTGQ